jgi:predicted alpha/beta-fold hydrolase
MLFPRAYDPQMGAHITSLREFDDRITALYCGFQSADDYYYRAAAARVLDKITLPTLILHASDDPFVKLTEPSRTEIARNPNILFLECAHGGHCAFLAAPDKQTGNDGYWAEHTAVRFLLQHSGM